MTLIANYTIGNLDSPTGAAAVTDPTSENTFLYITNQGNGTISIFLIDAVSGALSFVETVSTGSITSQPLFPLIAY